MKERPILFSAPMVRALLDGSKKQTRRVAKIELLDGDEITSVRGPNVDGDFYFHLPNTNTLLVSCPYGKVSNRLWVREAWRIGAWHEDAEQVAIDYLADNYSRKEWIDVPLDERDMFARLWKQSTDDAIKAGLKTDDEGIYQWAVGNSPCRGRPSIHMPRWASRITLEIINVRVERLQNISEEDARAEGVEPLDAERYERDFSICPQCGGTMLYDTLGANMGVIPDCDCLKCNTHAKRYKHLWESINGPGSWNLNPWVWVIEFKRL